MISFPPVLSTIPRMLECMQEYWSGLPFPILGYLPDPRVKLTSPASSVLTGGFFTVVLPGKPHSLTTNLELILSCPIIFLFYFTSLDTLDDIFILSFNLYIYIFNFFSYFKFSIPFYYVTKSFIVDYNIFLMYINIFGII